MTARRTLAIVAIVVIAVIVVASVGTYAILTSGKKGTVQIYLTDSVGSWAHVNVTFNTLQLHKANASNNSGWITIPIKNGTIDLVTLVDVSALLGQGNISAGKYTQLRIDVVNATGVMTDGTKVNFTVPSGQLKTTTPFNLSVSSGSTAKLTIDIDLEHSITQAGNKWMFKPVLGPVTQS